MAAEEKEKSLFQDEQEARKRLLSSPLALYFERSSAILKTLQETNEPVSGGIALQENLIYPNDLL